MEIRKANIIDIESLIELRLENAEYHANLLQYELKADYADFFKTHTENCFNNEDCNIIIALVGDKVIGYIIGFINQKHPIFDIGMEGLIDDFYISSSFQKKGYGNNLYDKLLIWFNHNNIEYINLNVYDKNLKGMKFWNKQNFKIQFNRMTKEIKL